MKEGAWGFFGEEGGLGGKGNLTLLKHHQEGKKKKMYLDCLS